jgi:hypothetical protein
MYSLQQNWRTGQNSFCLDAREVGEDGGGRERNVPNNVCTNE